MKVHEIVWKKPYKCWSESIEKKTLTSTYAPNTNARLRIKSKFIFSPCNFLLTGACAFKYWKIGLKLYSSFAVIFQEHIESPPFPKSLNFVVFDDYFWWIWLRKNRKWFCILEWKFTFQFQPHKFPLLVCLWYRIFLLMLHACTFALHIAKWKMENGLH